MEDILKTCIDNIIVNACVGGDIESGVIAAIHLQIMKQSLFPIAG